MSISGHESHDAGTVEWLTPPSIIDALGPFDLDPCAPIEQPYPTAARKFTIIDDGLAQPWPERDRVWLNPPYAHGIIGLWLAKLARHNRGSCLIFARTETDAFFESVWAKASAILFMRGRVNFRVGQSYSVVSTRQTFWAGGPAPGNAGAPTVLCAYGEHDADRLEACKTIEGHFVRIAQSGRRAYRMRQMSLEGV